jgi:hypothetical protein
MGADELLVLMGLGAVLPYMAEATLDWVKRYKMH